MRLHGWLVLNLLLAFMLGCYLMSRATSFVSPISVGNARAKSLSRAAEEEKDGGFMSFLKVEQEIELSPEEFEIALTQEIESQRRRYYINGEVKDNNLIVPWKPVDEKTLEADARRALKKNGIVDPNMPVQTTAEEAEKDSKIALSLVGDQDVKVEWTAGAPGTKVGYIIERKPVNAPTFRELISYENLGTLLVQQYAGADYEYDDQIVPPGTWTYRVLCRFRSGEVTVVDEKDIIVPELEGVDTLQAFGLLLGSFAFLGIYYSFTDPPVQ